jgi:hypothetical protein
MDEPALGAPSLRVRPFRTAAGVAGGAAVVATLAFAIQAVRSADVAIDRLHLAAGSVCGAILGAAMIGVALRPRENVAALQLVVVSAIASLGVGSLGNTSSMVVSFVPSIAAIVVVLLYPWNADIWRLGRRRPALLAIAAATAVPVIVYAVTRPQLHVQALPGDPEVRLDDYTGALLAGLFACVAAAIAGIGAPGWRLVGWIAGAAFAVFGAVVIVFAGSVDELSSGWGWAGIAVGVATAFATEISARRPT